MDSIVRIRWDRRLDAIGQVGIVGVPIDAVISVGACRSYRRSREAKDGQDERTSERLSYSCSASNHKHVVTTPTEHRQGPGLRCAAGRYDHRCRHPNHLRVDTSRGDLINFTRHEMSACRTGSWSVSVHDLWCTGGALSRRHDRGRRTVVACVTHAISPPSPSPVPCRTRRQRRNTGADDIGQVCGRPLNRRGRTGNASSTQASLPSSAEQWTPDTDDPRHPTRSQMDRPLGPGLGLNHIHRLMSGAWANHQCERSGRPDPVSVNVASTNIGIPPTSTVTSSQFSMTWWVGAPDATMSACTAVPR